MTNLKTSLIITLAIYLYSVMGVYAQDVETVDVDPASYQTGKWRISLDAGLCFRTGSTKDQKKDLIAQGFDKGVVDDYMTDITRGFKGAGQIHYMVAEHYGIGLDYNFFNSGGEINGYLNTGGGTIVYANAEDDVFINYLGASFYSDGRILKSRIKAYSQVSLGLTMFREETLYTYSPMVFTGNTLGMNLELGLEYFFQKNLSLGAGLNYFVSTLSKIKIDDGYSTETVELDDDESENLNHLDLNVGLRYYF